MYSSAEKKEIKIVNLGKEKDYNLMTEVSRFYEK